MAYCENGAMEEAIACYERQSLLKARLSVMPTIAFPNVSFGAPGGITRRQADRGACNIPKPSRKPQQSDQLVMQFRLRLRQYTERYTSSPICFRVPPVARGELMRPKHDLQKSGAAASTASAGPMTFRLLFASAAISGHDPQSKASPGPAEARSEVGGLLVLFGITFFGDRTAPFRSRNRHSISRDTWRSPPDRHGRDAVTALVMPGWGRGIPRLRSSYS